MVKAIKLKPAGRGLCDDRCPAGEFLHSIKKKGRKGRSCPGFRNLPGGQKFKALVPIIRGSDHRNLLASNENLPQSAPEGWGTL